MAGCADDEWSVDRARKITISDGREICSSRDLLWIHAAVVVMVEGDQGPIGDHSDDAKASIGGRASDQVLHTCSVEELDVRHGKDFAH